MSPDRTRSCSARCHDAASVGRRSGVSRHGEDDEHDDDDRGISAERTDRERDERRRRERTALPARVEMDTTLTIGAGRVAVITFDPGRREFVVVR